MNRLALIAGLTLAAPAAAQDLNAMNNAFNARLNGDMTRTQQGIVRSNAANPHVQALYRQYRARGGTMSLRQYAYAYAATGGFTPRGYANYGATSADIAHKQAGAMADYNGAVDAYHDAYSGYTGGFAGNQAEAGRGLVGQQSYYNPADGRTVSLGYIPPGSTTTQGGYTYRMAPNGQYYATNGDGAWYAVNPAARSPR